MEYNQRMPRVFEWNGYKFFFFSNEGFPLEPFHIHVRKDENIAKFWLEPEIKLASSYGFTSKELTSFETIIQEHEAEIRKNGMNSLVFEAKASRVWFDSDTMWILLQDGRQLAVPLAYFPRLMKAAPEQRQQYVISGGGIGLHWDNVDEDISVAGLLMGYADNTTRALL